MELSGFLAVSLNYLSNVKAHKVMNAENTFLESHQPKSALTTIPKPNPCTDALVETMVLIEKILAEWKIDRGYKLLALLCGAALDEHNCSRYETFCKQKAP